MSIKQHPRLIPEIIRGTPYCQKLRILHPASEKINSSAKEDYEILRKPKVRGIKRAGILAPLTAIVILLKRIAQFITKVTLAVIKE